MHFALIDFGIKAKRPRLWIDLRWYFALIDFGIKAKPVAVLGSIT